MRNGGCIDLFILLVVDNDVLEVHVGGCELVAVEWAVEWIAEWLVIGELAVRTYSAVAEGLVVVGLEVMLVLFHVGRHDHVERVGLTSNLTLGYQQALGVAAVTFIL